MGRIVGMLCRRTVSALGLRQLIVSKRVSTATCVDRVREWNPVAGPFFHFSTRVVRGPVCLSRVAEKTCKENVASGVLAPVL